MRPLRVVAVAALVLAFTGSAASSASATPLFGFNDNTVQWQQLSATDDARIAAQGGATTSRVTVDWNYVQPGPQYWVWSAYDAIYKADLAAGIQPVFELAYAPSWAWADGVTCSANCLYPPGPSHLSDWGRFAAAVAQRYPQLAAIEIWNEPNIKRYWLSGLDPAYYVSVVRAARDAIRTAGSNVPVVAGALGNGPLYDSADAMSSRTFLGRMYAAGLKGNADGISVHDYPSDMDLGWFFKTLTELRDVRDYHGDDVPVWMTETGVTTTGTTPDNLGDYGQAVLLPRLYGLARQMPDVRAVIVHTMVEPTRYALGSAERGFGMIDASLVPKAGFCALAAANATSFVCPSTVLPPAPRPDQERRWEAQELLQRAADAARVYRRDHGTLLGITSATLNAIDPAISATPAQGKSVPGANADPSRVLALSWTSKGMQAVLVCNASRSNTSYCIRHVDGLPWRYVSMTASIIQAANYTNAGGATSW
jgi:Cellulase (glycosyl hydrolase family 5)